MLSQSRRYNYVLIILMRKPKCVCCEMENLDNDWRHLKLRKNGWLGQFFGLLNKERAFPAMQYLERAVPPWRSHDQKRTKEPGKLYIERNSRKERSFLVGVAIFPRRSNMKSSVMFSTEYIKEGNVCWCTNQLSDEHCVHLVTWVTYFAAGSWSQHITASKERDWTVIILSRPCIECSMRNVLEVWSVH